MNEVKQDQKTMTLLPLLVLKRQYLVPHTRILCGNFSIPSQTYRCWSSTRHLSSLSNGGGDGGDGDDDGSHVVSNDGGDRCSDEGVVTVQDLRRQAEVITKSLYRTCLRSIRHIRHGNKYDFEEFRKREEEFRNGKSDGGGILSMAPPPNPEDELRSRAEYYHSYAREYFVQESDCLGYYNDPTTYGAGTNTATKLSQKDIDRYLYYVRKGEKDRRWLLGDMMFDDPYRDVAKTYRQPLIDKFIESSQQYFKQQQQEGTMPGAQVEKQKTTKSKNDDGFLDDDDLPEWWNKKK